jgi:membrane complex biogenesis BtpA family protein
MNIANFRKALGTPKTLIGMVHIGALPGTPRASLSLSALAEQAAKEARTLAECGFDAILIENMHDAPYVQGPHGPEITSAMTACALAVRSAIGKLPLGVQILATGNREALAVALASGAQFIRCENFVFAHVADEGLMPRAEAGELLRYRRAIGADHIAILTDIQKKHAAHAITADIDIGELAHGAEFFGSDGLIVTGAHTGDETASDDLEAVRHASKLPIIVGSGTTRENIGAMFQHADAVIVGSSIKRDGHWTQPVDRARAKALVAAARKHR